VDSVNEDDQIISVVTTEVDVWAFGCLVSYVFSAYVPWTPRYKDNAKVIQKLLNKKAEFPVPENIKDSNILNIIKCATVVDAKKRSSMAQLNELVSKL